MARARLSFGNKQPHRLNDLNHGTTTTAETKFTNSRQFNTKLSGSGFHFVFSFRSNSQQQTARSLQDRTVNRALHAAFHPSDDHSWQSCVRCRPVHCAKQYSSTCQQFQDRLIIDARLHTNPDTFRLNAQQTKTRNVGHRFSPSML